VTGCTTRRADAFGGVADDALGAFLGEVDAVVEVVEDA
jgi:hypothetical protein